MQYLSIITLNSQTYYVDSKKIIQMNLYTKQKQIHRQTNFGYQMGKGGEEEQFNSV